MNIAEGDGRMPNEASDVLNAFRHGDMDAFETLFRQHRRAVYGWILRIVRDAATARRVNCGDLLAHLPGACTLEPSRGFAGWARRIATHAALDWMKSRRVERELTTEFFAEPASAVAADEAVSAKFVGNRDGLWTAAAQVADRSSIGGDRRAAAQGLWPTLWDLHRGRKTTRVSRASNSTEGP